MHFWLTFVLLFHLTFGAFSPLQQLDLVRILSPKSGDVLQGNVVITGTVTGVGLQYAEISFQFQDTENSDEWFLISRIDNSVIDDDLISWDTSSIADGNYRLLVKGFYEDGHQLQAISDQLRIRNYTPIETKTADEILTTPVITSESVVITSTSTPPILSTATNMPSNNLSLEMNDLFASATTGAVIGILVLIVLGVWLIIRRRRIG